MDYFNKNVGSLKIKIIKPWKNICLEKYVNILRVSLVPFLINHKNQQGKFLMQIGQK